MRRYSTDEVLAALAAVGRPASTSEIAEQARITAGESRYSESGNVDVVDALRELVITGVLISAKSTYRHSGYVAAEHDHIVPSSTPVGHRVYATPAMSATWRTWLDTVAAESWEARTLAAVIKEALDVPAAGGGVTVHVHAHRERVPAVDITLDLHALRYLALRLGAES